ncbi:MAG: acylphosphatase [Thermoplasmata archaeon]|jgi:acylphosphatase|nr:acylphosphatase [Thermoplasmata archaeon]
MRLHVWVSGRVQGVHFRASLRREAEAFGLAGWVRNLPDGRVEAVAEGEPAAVESLVGWCRRGPERAVVSGIEAKPEPEEGLRGFEVRRTPAAAAPVSLK